MIENKQEIIVLGEPMNLEVGKALPGPLNAKISEMATEKKNAYGNRLGLFRFYMKGSIGLEVQEGVYETEDREKHSVGRLFNAVDTASRAVASRAISLFASAILPMGVDSISVRSARLEEALKRAKSESTTQKIKEDLAEKTHIVRDILGDPRSGFIEIVSSSVADVMNFGTCFAMWENGTVRHIPFQDVYFLLPASENWQWYSWITTRSDAWVFEKYGYYSPAHKAQINVEYLVCPAQQRMAGKFYYLLVTSLKDEKKVLGYEWYEHDKLPVFACRLGTGNVIYTSGAGLNTLGSIATVNYANNTMKLGGELTLSPHLVKTQSSTFNPGGVATINSQGDAENTLRATPGEISTVVVDETTKGGKPFEILSQPASIIEAYNKIYADALTNIEQGYGADLFSTFGAELTATEINEKRAASVRVFNGLSVQYYSNFLLPIVERFSSPILIASEDIAKLVSAVLPNLPYASPPGSKTGIYYIKIHNYSDIQTNQMKLERMSQIMQMKGMVAQMGQFIPPEEIQRLNKEIDDASNT